MQVSYADWREAESSFRGYVSDWARAHPDAAICDVGGGARPLVDEEERRGRRYVVIDIDAEELAKCPDDVERVQADVTTPAFRSPGRFELVVSNTVAEHVMDPEAFHRNVLDLLEPGGTVAHFFPTLWALPYVVNRLLPERLTEPVLLRIQPNRAAEGDEGKFRAYYRWCRGPTRRQVRRFQRLGYEIERYHGYFGHGYYWPVGPMERLEDWKTRRLLEHPVPALTAYAIVVMRRPRA